MTAIRPSVLLPLPISANRIWRRYGKRIVKNPEYISWQNDASVLLAMSKMKYVRGKYNLFITLPEKTRGDMDNYIKPLSDILTLNGIIDDDKHCNAISVTRSNVPKGHCYLEIEACQ